MVIRTPLEMQVANPATGTPNIVGTVDPEKIGIG